MHCGEDSKLDTSPQGVVFMSVCLCQWGTNTHSATVELYCMVWFFKACFPLFLHSQVQFQVCSWCFLKLWSLLNGLFVWSLYVCMIWQVLTSPFCIFFYSRKTLKRPCSIFWKQLKSQNVNQGMLPLWSVLGFLLYQESWTIFMSCIIYHLWYCSENATIVLWCSW